MPLSGATLARTVLWLTGASEDRMHSMVDNHAFKQADMLRKFGVSLGQAATAIVSRLIPS